MSDYLIVGLGNPGTKYEKTRHNLGFLVLEELAKKWNVSFKRGWRLQGQLASGVVGEKKVHLLMPTTYMNLSGSAVVKAINYYKIELKDLLVVVDDVYVKFGTMRFRDEGSSGGHNGLKSIAGSIGTQKYARLRMGIGPKEGKELSNGAQMPLEDYVLANFTASEMQELPQFVEQGASFAEKWLSGNIT